jgi:hypothetical protein
VAFSGRHFTPSSVSDSIVAHDGEVIGTVEFLLALAGMYRWVARLRS